MVGTFAFLHYFILLIDACLSELNTEIEFWDIFIELILIKCFN